MVGSRSSGAVAPRRARRVCTIATVLKFGLLVMRNAPVFDAALDALREVRYADAVSAAYSAARPR